MNRSSTPKLVAWFSHHKKRIGSVFIGHAGKRVEEYLFDWIIYGFVSYYATLSFGAWYGSLLTFAIMAPISALFCWLYVLAYDWAKRDLFGFETLKELRHDENSKGWWGRQLRSILKLGDFPAFIALSIYYDPFMVTVYLRKRGHGHQGLTWRDWRIFWYAVLFSNAYWTLRWTVIFEVIGRVSAVL